MALEPKRFVLLSYKHHKACAHVRHIVGTQMAHSLQHKKDNFRVKIDDCWKHRRLLRFSKSVAKNHKFCFLKYEFDEVFSKISHLHATFIALSREKSGAFSPMVWNVRMDQKTLIWRDLTFFMSKSIEMISSTSRNFWRSGCGLRKIWGFEMHFKVQNVSKSAPGTSEISAKYLVEETISIKKSFRYFSTCSPGHLANLLCQLRILKEIWLAKQLPDKFSVTV